MNSKQLTLALITLAVFASTAYAERFTSCHDGDTCTLESGQKVRVSGIDAPEIGQPYAIESRDYIRHLLIGHEAALDCKGRSYKRRVCKIFVGGVDIQREMVGAGMAYDSPKYSNGLYGDTEASARTLQLGVWQLPDGGIRPWDYRHPPTTRTQEGTP